MTEVQFPNEASEFVYMRTYSRWRDDLGRRETYAETADRVVDFLREQRPQTPAKVFRKIREGILSFSVFPSMRLMWAAGSAARKNNITIYNCSGQLIDSPVSFAETLYILMCGAGAGFRVSLRDVSKLPVVPVFNYATMANHSYVVPDDKEGWADSVKDLITLLYKGETAEFDYTQIRPKGSRLLTMGGRASGPDPLIKLHQFIKDTFNAAQARQLTTLEVHDIECEIADTVVSGGVRRSSLISVSDLNDDLLRTAKEWPFPMRRANSNNSACYVEKPSAIEFMREWTALAASGTGERGIFNLQAMQENAPSRRDGSRIVISNPCAEISLRDKEFCNLSTVIIRPEDDLDTLLDKVETATWIGTLQASFTDFPYLRPEWAENCREEALLGVSLCGHADNPAALTAESLKALKARAIKVNRKAAKTLGINPSAAITCGKPDGTVSQVASSGSGCHPWYSRYFIRRYRIAATDPLYLMMRDQGFVFTPENGQKEDTATTFVVSFPCRAPDGALLRSQTTAMQQLQWYLHVQENWCEHNQSITIYVKDDEWLEIGNEVYKNWGRINGVSFLPYDNGHYQQAPYEEITIDQYLDMKQEMPKIDYSQLSKYEVDDNTEGAKTLACVGDKCEII
jgi:ribonucleoside-triphosphate reductase (thioredoxin)